MGQAMARNNFSNYDRFRTVEEIVADTVTFFRNRGHKRDIAIEQTALSLGITPRKAKSIFYGEIFTLLDGEITSIRAAFARHLEWQAEDYARRSEAVKLKLRQMDLGV